MFAENHIHSIPRDSPREGDQQNQQKSMNQHIQWTPGQLLRDPGICSSDPQRAPEIQATISSTKSASASSFHHQAAAHNQHQLPASTTRQQHQISYQLQPPGSNTKSASAFSSHHQAAAPNQHQLPPPGSSTKPASASSFYHQAAALHQPASSKASSQPAVNSTSLPHPHHGSQVCCCLDIL